MNRPRRDPSAGYEAVASDYMVVRDPRIGVAAVRRWARDARLG